MLNFLAGSTGNSSNAFGSCINLSSLTLHNVEYINVNIFNYKVSSLIVVDAPDLTMLPRGTFYANTESLQKINIESVSGIQSALFANFGALTSANINGATEIGASAFYNCSSLVTLEAENARVIESGAFTRCNSLTSLYLPNIEQLNCTFRTSSLKNVYLDGTLSSIPDEAFYSDGYLSSVHLPSSLTVIGHGAFGYSNKLIDINLENVKTIDVTAFANSNLSTICLIMPDVELIGNRSFDSSKVMSVALTGSSTTETPPIIGYKAFNFCQNLKDVSITNFDRINQEAFYNCSSLTSVFVKDVDTIISVAFAYCPSLKTVTFDNVRAIGGSVCEGCTSLSSVTLNNVESLGLASFAACTSLTEINAKDIITVGNYAFDYCASLTSVYLPKATSIADSAFDGCSSLISANLASMISLNDVLLSSCKDSLQYLDVSSISSATSSAFTPLTKLVSLNISGAETIEDYAFDECNSLSSVNLQNVKYIGRNAFYEIPITSVYAPNIEFIDKYAFLNARSSLKTVYLDGTLTHIYGSCFYGQANLSSIHLPSGLKYIGDYALFSAGLPSLSIPSTVNRIDLLAFCNSNLVNGVLIPSTVFWDDAAVQAFGYSNIRQIKIPNVDVIPTYMFINCKNLSSVEIPESVKYFDDNAFSYCSSLSSIQLPSDLRQVGSLCFSNCSSLTSLEFPSGVSYLGNNALNGCSNLSNVKFNSVFNLSSQSLNFGDNNVRNIILPWSQGEIPGEPWGAGSNTTFTYTGDLSINDILSDNETGCDMPEPHNCIAYIPFTHDSIESATPVELRTAETGTITKGSGKGMFGTRTEIDGQRCFYFGTKNNYETNFGLKYTQCLSGLPSTGSISMSMWLNPRVKISNSDYNGYAFALLGQQVNNKCLFLFGRRKDDRLYAGTWGSDLGNTIAYSDQVGSWWHQVIVYDDENHLLKFYMNDELIDTKSLTISITTKELNIGFTNRQDNSAYFHDLRIYTKALTPENIHWLYEHKC